MFEREKMFEHSTLGQFRSKTWGECVNLQLIYLHNGIKRHENQEEQYETKMKGHLFSTFSSSLLSSPAEAISSLLLLPVIPDQNEINHSGSSCISIEEILICVGGKSHQLQQREVAS